MPTAPTGTDIALAYAIVDDVALLLPEGTIGKGSAHPIPSGKVQAAILRFSRKIDGMLGGCGFFTPFPAVDAANPDLPAPVREWVTYKAAAEIAMYAAGGQPKNPITVGLDERAEAMLHVDDDGELRGTLMVDSMQEYIEGENFELTTSTAGVETGQLGASWYYRLRNRGLLVDNQHPLVFAGDDNKEVFNSDGMPFDYGRDWWVVSASQSVIALGNRGTITDKATRVNYWFSWRDPEHGVPGLSQVRGVSAYVTP